MSEPIDVSGQPAGSVTGDGRFRLDLTGPGSHVLVTEPGRGNLVIGPAGMGRKADLHVAPDDAIHWPAFAPFATPAGSPWPRHIDYHGNDSGFAGWSAQRAIEQFTWAPVFADTRRLDARMAKIQTLHIGLEAVTGRLEITLPEETRLGLSGDLTRIGVAGALPGLLSLHPTLGGGPARRRMFCPTWACCRACRRWRCTASRWRRPFRCKGSSAFRRWSIFRSGARLRTGRRWPGCPA
ncbi:hypothetical protein [Achromobacter ruhlandii]|uniref:hypothetical protein n=1 Tax=Achromobacter ruhlandii TaxID=72557 RepID=UPI001E43ACF7|nr:hypothetical protein [Achromobacter ruhlandii]